MDNITLGQIATGMALLMALVGGFKYLKNMLSEAIANEIKPIKEGFKGAQDDLAMLKDVTYIMLSHMATNNNTQEMKNVLDKYVQQNMK